MKSLEQVRKEVNRKKFYTPLEIVKNKWIITSPSASTEASRRFVYRAIDNGLIPAVNLSSAERKPRHHVKGKDIVKYLKTHVHGVK